MAFMNSKSYLKLRRERIYRSYKRKYRQQKVGILGKKILLLLAGGLTLSLTHRPDYQFRVIKAVAKEWREINKKNLNDAIRRLYRSQMIDYEENKDGTVAIVLGVNGKKKVLKYKLDEMKLKKADRWDGFWRMVVSDIPEHKKWARDAFARKLKELGFVPFQKSVFVYPYDCRDELDFIIEVFDLRPYVRFALVKDIDVALDLRRKFKLL